MSVLCQNSAVPSIYSSARTELAKLLIYGLFRKIRVLAQDGEDRERAAASGWYAAEFIVDLVSGTPNGAKGGGQTTERGSDRS